MNQAFRACVEALHPKFEDLISMTPVSVEQLPRKMPSAGVYLLSEGDTHLYVGRSSGLRKRLQQHSRPSSDRFNATFAFRMACVEAGHASPSYSQGKSRALLEKDPEFAAAFNKAKRRVRRMAIRFVSEGDPVRQALLEIYAAVALATPYNDFGTH